ncbi:MAG: replication initiator protein [Microvirus sp.]|nr:MAG: replication initiator protein [Microvirus sp.]
MTRSKSPTQAPQTVPCGRCMGCRLSRSRDWATRIKHEASLHEDNVFLTLTYRDENLPEDYSISTREMQLFIKRLRKSIEPTKIRFYACGEYGDTTNRPHYHAIIFGWCPPDLEPWRKTKTGHLVYISSALQSLWPSGDSYVGHVNHASAGYVARYCLKKMGGQLAEEHYLRVHPVTGALCQVSPEFGVMSTRPGIGRVWFDKWESDCFPSDFVVIDGQKVPVPKYYRERLKGRFVNPGSDPNALLDKDDLYPSKLIKREHIRAHAEDNTDERLAVRGEVQRLRIAQYQRDFEE